MGTSGMFRSSSCFRVFVAMSVIGVCLSAVAAAQTPPTSSGNLQAGKDLFLRYSCYAWHGGAGARLVPMRMTMERFTAYVHNPRQMPPYSAKLLSDAQLGDLWAY